MSILLQTRHMDLECFQGDTYILDIIVHAPNGGRQDIAGWKFPLVVKMASLVGQLDSTATPPGGYATNGVITNASRGEAQVIIPACTTAELIAPPYRYSVGWNDGQGNQGTYQAGSFTFRVNPHQTECPVLSDLCPCGGAFNPIDGPLTWTPLVGATGYDIQVFAGGTCGLTPIYEATVSA